MWGANSLEKTLTLGKNEEKEAAEDEMVVWHHRLSGMSLSKLLEMVKDGEAWRTAVHRVTKSRTQLSHWTTTKFARIQNRQIIAIPPLHLLWVAFIKYTKGKRRKKKSSPHPSCEGHWFTLPVTNINFIAIFARFGKKKSGLYGSIQCIIYSVVAKSLLDKNAKTSYKNALF